MGTIKYIRFCPAKEIIKKKKKKQPKRQPTEWKKC